VRLQVTSTGNQLRVAAVLFDTKEVEKLVRILNANKELLGDSDVSPEPASGTSYADETQTS
jgi:hypothetical protein